MEWTGFFQGWTLVAAVITSTAAAAAVIWRTFKAGDKLAENTAHKVVDMIGDQLEKRWRKDTAEIVQTKLDNGSALRQVLDAFRAEVSERFSGVELRLGNVERQLENVITEEIPQITLLTEAVLAEQAKVARNLDDANPT